MIFTIGDRETYDPALSRSPAVYKLGRQPDYPGGSVFPTREAADRHLRQEGLAAYGVYGVDADWEQDTEASTAGPWHDLLRDARIIPL